MGLGNSLKGWAFQIEHFGRDGSGFTVLAMDNRGVGQSELGFSLIPNQTTRTYAEDIREVVEELDWHKVHVLGVSMGGMIAQEFAYICSDRICSLVLVNTAARGSHTGASKTSSFQSVARSILAKAPERRAELALPNLYSTKTLSGPRGEFLREYHMYTYQTRGRASLRTYLSQWLAIRAHTLSEEQMAKLRQDKMRILVVAGAEDKLIPPSGGEHLARQLEAELWLVEDAGHGIVFEMPDVFNDRVERFFLENSKMGESEKKKPPSQSSSHHTATTALPEEIANKDQDATTLAIEALEEGCL
eukprot:CAMPEP_0184651576 /NCGR_PEP_ID=MMETSP0308-20130426/9225_1 /TAXON_ID=38269 /ORGANISM="Gloeochaete witrockiana, Strain SAG 46.84" /LENGTH=302 /DNA_ID=CAMNT_0027085915 /DNA_START=179 /DNA_END=1087 /DNA_ORIENTATION=-